MANRLLLQQSQVFLCAIMCLWPGISTDNSTLTMPLKDSQAIFSSSQTFKLGFFSPANSNKRYLGIMFNLPVMAVIWVANRDKPLNDSSGTFMISTDGNLVVLNEQKEVLWSSNVSNTLTNTSAQLFDSGNLVLHDSSSGRIAWQSFQNPTDSYLRGMRLSAPPGTKEKDSLTSWRSPSDASAGDFSMGINTVSLPQVFFWNASKPYWRSGPWDGSVFIGVEDTSSFYKNVFDVVYDNDGSVYVTFTYWNESIVMYFQLDSMGSLLKKIWEPAKQEWDIYWSTSLNTCDVYSKCGPNGSCNTRDSKFCTCLPGFEPRDEEEYSTGNWTGGCIRRTSLQCQRNDSVDHKGKQDGFVRLTGMKLPDFEEWIPALELDCASLCLNNCSCIAYAYYTGIGCMHWRDSLIDAVQFSSGGVDLYVRVAYSELEKKKDMTAVIAGTVVTGCLFISIFAYFFIKLSAKHKGNKQKKKEDQRSLFEAWVHHPEKGPKDNLKQGPNRELPAYNYETLATVYSYETLAMATDDFHSANQLGKGGFGEVYKGKLLGGKEIAVKRLSKSSSQGIEEFMNEVFVISKVQHRNLVRLLGCCVEGDDKMLIYEYMPNGSLDAYLFDSKKHDLLDWRRRTVIIEGIGRGLLYLHRDSRLKIIHRDLKASNILLDEELNPKISDFGLAKIFMGNQDQAATKRVVGTYGYMAPEYALAGRYSEKSDIYSFGVLMLEIVSGRRNTSFSHNENGLSLILYAWRLWHDNEIVKLIDASVFRPGIEMEASRYIHVALLCVQELAKDRPKVSVVLSMLNSEIAELPSPTLPAFTRRLVAPESERSQQSEPSVNNMSITSFEAR